MRTAPVLRGGLLVRLAWLVFGLFLCAVGVVCFLESQLGLPPWDVLHQGIANKTPLSFGIANLAVAMVVLALAWSLGARIGVGTVANAALIGLFVVALEPLADRLDLPLAGRIALMAAGLAGFGVGSAFYIGAALGAGPRDSLMLVGSHRTGTRIGVVRAGIELTVLVAGFALGGVVGLGTVLFAALIGPAVEVSFSLISRSALTR